MVGKNSRGVIRELLYTPYGLCEEGKLDCFRMVYDYLVSLGYKLPTELEGQTLETYGQFYLDKPQEAESLMIRFFKKFTEVIPKAKVFMGDILVMAKKDGRKFLAIDAGNGNIVAPTEKFGVTMLSMSDYKLEEVLRCRLS